MLTNSAQTLRCRACRSAGSVDQVILDLGDQPAAGDFPLLSDPGPDALYPLSMWCCTQCELAQLAQDFAAAPELPTLAPDSMRHQGAQAVDDAVEAGIGGRTAYEFASPHGGSWLPLLREAGFVSVADGPVDLVVDSMGMMHDPDQDAAIAQRAARLGPGGVLLLNFHNFVSIWEQEQWSALRHGHYAYYSASSLMALLAQQGLVARRVWRYPLYGGTYVLAAVRGGQPDPVWADGSVEALVSEERSSQAGLGDRLQAAADRDVVRWTERVRDAPGPIFGYGAGSRAVVVLGRAPELAGAMTAVADGAAAKAGRRIPGTTLPIISAQELVAAAPAQVVMLVPDLGAEIARTYPALASAIVELDGSRPAVEHR